MTELLSECARRHRLIVAHRGVSAGNIPCNTMAAYEIALMQGADMIEVDLNRSADGELILFHPGMEQSHLGIDRPLTEMTWAEIQELRYLNYDRVPTQFGVVKFDDFLEQFRDRCYINIDKFWNHPQEIYRAIRRHGMLEQVVVKSALKEEVLSVLEDVAPDVAFMPVVREAHPMHEALLRRPIHYVGVEVLFAEEDSPLATAEFCKQMHKDGKLVWVNSIIYDVRKQISGKHSDDTALTVSPEYGWGWLADRPFDLIQTDWPMMLIDFLKQTGRYARKTTEW